jgi:mitogen-activated protein kinase kinase 1
MVQKVVHVPTGVFLAVKIVQMNVQAEIRKNIIGELRALHSTRCPYVVAYRGAFFGDGSVSIVLEYADGGSVGDVTRKLGYIEEPPLREIARQTLLGLEYLHCEKKIVHRDVKPSNVLVNTDGSVKIGDFGVSSHLANSVAKCDSWVGTVTYMSPERISGESYAFDSDVWSLGLSLLECATGRFPYPPEDATEDKIKESTRNKRRSGFGICWTISFASRRRVCPSSRRARRWRRSARFWPKRRGTTGKKERRPKT